MKKLEVNPRPDGVHHCIPSYPGFVGTELKITPYPCVLVLAKGIKITVHSYRSAKEVMKKDVEIIRIGTSNRRY